MLPKWQLSKQHPTWPGLCCSKSGCWVDGRRLSCGVYTPLHHPRSLCFFCLYPNSVSISFPRCGRKPNSRVFRQEDHVVHCFADTPQKSLNLQLSSRARNPHQVTRHHEYQWPSGQVVASSVMQGSYQRLLVSCLWI